MRYDLSIALAVLLLAAIVPRAEAHAFLDHSEPAVGSTVKASPGEVRLWFTEKLELGFSTVQVFDSAGKQIDKKDKHVVEKADPSLAVSLPPLAPGKYKVRWRVVSTDTHVTKGDFTFQVAK
jgi:methionine-rich copper-binding protein CopC